MRPTASRGAQDAGDQPGLAPDLGHDPSGERRDPAGEGERRRRSTAASAAARRSWRSSQAPRQASASISMPMRDHDAEREEHRRDRRRVRRERVEALHLAVRVVRQDQARRLGNLDREIVAPRLRVGHANSTSGTPRSVFQIASIAAIFAGWCSSVFSPCWSPTKICSGASTAATTTPVRSVRSAAASPARAQQAPGRKPGDDEGRGQPRGEHHVREAVGKGRVEDHLRASRPRSARRRR